MDENLFGKPVTECQSCGNGDLLPVVSLGYLPPVNRMRRVGEPARAEPFLPADLLRCPRCELVQLGFVADRDVVFPPDYPYTSGSTRVLRENFAELAEECRHVLGGLREGDLVVDIGSNDGTLLSNFTECRVLGVEPTDAAEIAAARGILTRRAFFTGAQGPHICTFHGPARLITAANVFAHVPDVCDVVEGIVGLLPSGGVFVSENHYLLSLLERNQWDTIYHEHLRYYSLTSLKNLLERHGLEVFHAKRIPTHGGSFRTYAARKGEREVQASVGEMLEAEKKLPGLLRRFDRQVQTSKRAFWSFMKTLGRVRVAGIGAPSRGSTLVSYLGLEGVLRYVCELPSSYKVGRYMPGTNIPVVDEARLFEDQPGAALLLSWHIADELVPKLREKGYKHHCIVPLPEPDFAPRFE